MHLGLALTIFKQRIVGWPLEFLTEKSGVPDIRKSIFFRTFADDSLHSGGTGRFLFNIVEGVKGYATEL